VAFDWRRQILPKTPTKGLTEKAKKAKKKLKKRKNTIVQKCRNKK